MALPVPVLYIFKSQEDVMNDFISKLEREAEVSVQAQLAKVGYDGEPFSMVGSIKDYAEYPDGVFWFKFEPGNGTRYNVCFNPMTDKIGRDIVAGCNSEYYLVTVTNLKATGAVYPIHIADEIDLMVVGKLPYVMNKFDMNISTAGPLTGLLELFARLVKMREDEYVESMGGDDNE